MSQVYPLHGNQMRAVDPRETVWLSASAGTGKTQVLSARVLRLLLQDHVTPSQILCLTFTKAGAAEMAVRVNEVLANWVRMPAIALAKDLEAIGASFDPETVARARTLFAAVLDCPGGGLRIDTIHAFAQWLLASFPEEAGLSHGTRAMEDRDRAILSREVLANLLISAEEQGDHAVLDALSMLALRMAPADVERYLLRCAQAREAWEGPGTWQQGDLRGSVNHLLGLPEQACEADLQTLCNDVAFDVQSLRRCMEINRAWNTKTGLAAANAIGDWLAACDADRVVGLDGLWAIFFTQKGELKSTKLLDNVDANYADYAARVGASLLGVCQYRTLLELADWLTPALTLGRAFARHWQAAKQREGLIDFDDQIREAARLLTNSDLAEWIRYKLDRRFDHILIDEAQDTNEAQWQIINELTGDFFSGEGQHGDTLRTLFVVGDYKQAIFRFQGTSPDNFERARQRVAQLMAGASANLDARRDRQVPRELQSLGLGKSFRTAKPILEFVDLAIQQIGHENFGLSQAPDAHEGEPRPGLVTLWQPVGLRDAEQADGFDEDEGEAEESGDGGEETWLSRPDRLLADKIAQQIKAWLDPQGPGFPLIKGRHRRASAGDVMVLVRKRKELAGLIVARLHAAGVKVAGVDRLRLGAPLAVKDLIAALRFAAQPLDDLNLAALLVSPLIGWSQDQLLAHGYRDRGVALWAHLRASRDGDTAQAVALLLELLARADYEPPQMLLHWLLVGPWLGRERLIARLGREANDPIDELVNAAHAYAMSDTASLVGFLHWFDAGEGELKREAEGAGDLVRVMTVHGSKGLQAPIVILADAASDPSKGPGSSLTLQDPRAEALGDSLHAPKIPLPALRKDEKLGRIAAAEAIAQAEEQDEHWRLLYVAMTRAEEALFVTGALGAKESEPVANSWYAQLAAVMPGEALTDDLWASRKEFGSLPPQPPASTKTRKDTAKVPALPSWVHTPLAPEPRPPRPLAPSSLGEDDTADPPFASAAGSDAALRGSLIHKLLERLPELPADARHDAALRWLSLSARDMSDAARADIVQSALGVLGQAEWANLFSTQALAEVPIAALVGDRVVAGTIDRLVFEDDCIRLIDYKSTRRPPEELAQVPQAVLRQMAAYVAALEVTYPGRRIEAALLYTQSPVLIAIPAAVIAAHKPQLSTPE